MKCKPCRVTFCDVRYHIACDGTVSVVNEYGLGPTTDRELDKQVRAEAARQRRNRNSRERNQAMRDLGLVRTPYGWE